MYESTEVCLFTARAAHLLVGFLQVWFSLDWEGRLESWLHWGCWRHHWLSHGGELGGRQETKAWHLPIRRKWHLGRRKNTEFHLGRGITFAFPAGSSKALCLLKSLKRQGKDEAGQAFECRSNNLVLQSLTRTDTKTMFLWEDGGLSHIHSPPTQKSLLSFCTKENNK